ncbi:MAG: ClpXP protease specificity-enhancing factor [Saezia sp.]
MEQEQEQIIPTRPYFIRAIYEWCTDNGFTPYLAVRVDENVQVPMEYVRNGEVVLNISFTATSDLDLGNEYIRFQARFAGSPRQLIVPVDHVIAIYARENGQGMAFTTPQTDSGADHSSHQNKESGLHLVDDEQAGSQEPEVRSPSSSPAKKADDKNKPKKPTLRIVE